MLSIIKPFEAKSLATSFISLAEVTPARGRPGAVLLFAGVFGQPELINLMAHRMWYLPLAFASDPVVESELGSLVKR
jgi:hypothetical protein